MSSSVAGALTPVPGGVGPLTIAMLMTNTVKAARLRRGARAPAAATLAPVMLRLGLTGGIGSGKSTVAAMLRERGVPVLDADELAHELLEPGQEAYEEVVREFGKQILRRTATIDRAKLGAIVFADAAKRARLNQIMHPRIRAITEEWFASLDHPGGPDFAFEDAALIIESGGRERFRPRSGLLVPPRAATRAPAGARAFARRRRAPHRRANAHRRKAPPGR